MDDAPFLKQNKVLTVSIAAYNVEKTVGETLDSLLTGVPAETLKKLEILVVNDGSKDGTKEVVAKYEEQYPESVTLISKENAGWGSTVNTSISFAKGKYLKLLDGDDWFQTENLPEFIDFLENSEADMVLSPYVKRFPDKEELEDCHKEVDEAVCGIEILKPDIDIYMHELAVSTDKLRAGNVQIAERCFYTDNEFAFEAIKCSDSVQRYEKPVYIYRLGNAEQSVGINGIRKHFRDTKVVAERLCESFLKYEKESGTTSAKTDILERKIILTTDALYVSYLLMDSHEIKKELIEFDRGLKSRFLRVYELTNKVKKIRILRMTCFLTYKYMAGKVKERYAG